MRLPTYTSRAVCRLKRTIKNRQVLVLEMRRALDGVFFADELLDIDDLLRRVAERPQTERHGAVQDLEHAATGQLLVLDERDVRFNTGGIAVHHEADCPRRCQDGRLCISETVAGPKLKNTVPNIPGRVLQMGRPTWVDLLDSVSVHLHDSHHRLGIVWILSKRPDNTCDLCAC